MTTIKLPATALDMDIVEQIHQWTLSTDPNETRILIVGGPNGTAKRQHTLAGIYGINKWPVSRRATADHNDTSGEYSFMLRHGLAEIDFGMHPGHYRKNATTCVQGAIHALEHQKRLIQNTQYHQTNSSAITQSLILFRNCQAARSECVLAALNNAANSKIGVILLTERPTPLTHTTSAWKTDVVLLSKQEGEKEIIRQNSGYLSHSLHDQKAIAIAKQAAKVIRQKNGASVAAVQKLATELQKDQHNPILIATLIMKELEMPNNPKQNKCFCEASKKLIDGIENGYRLNLHLELFLATLVCWYSSASSSLTSSA